MRRKFALETLAFCLFVYGFPLSAFGQSNTGTLNGTVVGPDGGVISNANVVVVDNQTGKERRLTTSEVGTFTIPQLEVGTYTVTVTAQGFKTFTATELKIDIGKDYGLTAKLEIGEITESVTISAGADLVHASSGELSNSIGPRQILELPLNGRNPLSLISLHAGVSQNGTATTINGQQSSFTNITRDGVNIQDNFIRSNAVTFTPDRSNVDDVSEFTIVTQNAGAELGTGSSQVQLVTPRGSNALHGGVFLYNRNSRFSATDFFRNRDDLGKPFLNRNQFGGKLGGAILKDKLFFFGTYEGFRLRQSTANPANATILLPQARQGIFTYTDNSGVQRTVNVLNLAGVSADPLVQSRIIDRTPTSGNNDRAGDGLNTTGFSFSPGQDTDREAFTTRIDFEISQNHSVNGVYSYKKEFNLRPDIDGANGFRDTPFGFQDAHTPFLALAYRATFSDSFTNEVRGGWQASDPKFGNTIEDPEFFVGVPLINSPEVTFRPQGRDTDIINFQDNAVWAKGAHSFRFGGQAQFYRIDSFTNFSTIPTLNLATNVNTPQLASNQFPGGITTAQRNTANGLLALLAGIVGNANVSAEAATQTSGFTIGATDLNKLRYDNYSLYLADQWRATPQLTLNLGLRWELTTPIRTPDGLYLEPVIPQGLDATAAILDSGGSYDFVGGNSGGGNKFHKPDYDNFAPVLSAAWSPQFENGFLSKIFPDGGRSVIRGGYRMSYVNDEFVRGADNALGGNQGLTQTVRAIENGSTSINRRLSQGLPAFVLPEFKVPRTFLDNNIAAGNFFNTVFAVDPNLQIPRIHEWNFSIEREIGWNTAFEIRYVGGRSDNLLRAFDLNQVRIRETGFVDDFIRARSNLLLATAAGAPLTGDFNPNVPGSQMLTVFPNMVAGGLLNNATIRNSLLSGDAGELALIYIVNGLEGSVPFRANPNAGVVDLLTNAGKYRYNALQTEIRHRFSGGLHFQANYTFQKTLSDAGAAETGQSNFAPFLDIRAPNLEYARAGFDQTHVFNLNTIYELPFGAGKPWLNDSGLLNQIVGGWQVTSIIRAATGAPFSITDPRGTLNRAGRSGSQTALTDLNKDQIKNLVGIFKTPCGIYYINPSVINLDLSDCSGTGRAAEGFGSTPFAGQVFFNNGPGQTGNLERTFLNGPFFFNWDASIIKKFRIKEDIQLQFRVEAFNVLNRANFFLGGSESINSTSFGEITSTFGPRIIQLVGRIDF
ncbi:MAG: TonB-dependent receptor [Blastocatellia bacterium]|nr:TonB-dependent receptor [Blastocatellia bacterium]